MRNKGAGYLATLHYILNIISPKLECYIPTNLAGSISHRLHLYHVRVHNEIVSQRSLWHHTDQPYACLLKCFRSSLILKMEEIVLGYL